MSAVSTMAREWFGNDSVFSRLSLGSNLSRLCLASLICLCMLTVGVGNAWATADHSVNESWDFGTSGNANWSSTNCNSYCGGWGRNKDASPSVYKSNIQNFKDVDFSLHENVSLTIYVKAGTNGGTNSYTVKLLDKDGNVISGAAYTKTKTGGMGSGSNASSAAESSLEFTPTQAFAGYRIEFYPKSFITKTRYVLEYDDKAGGCANQVNITNSSTTSVTHGSFDVDKTGSQDACSALSVVVTPNPDDHYHVATVSATNPATTGTAGAAVDNGDGTYTITYSANAKGNSTISVTFAEDTKYTVTWMSNGSQHTTTEVYSGEKPTFPSNPSSCDVTSTAFYGWTTATWTGKLDDVSAKTIYLSGDAMPAVSGAVTYYAVFAKESATAFERITSADNIYIGQKIAIVSNKQDYILPSNFNATTAATHPNSNDNKLTVTSSQVWTITDIDEYGYYKLKNSTTQMGVNRTSGLTSGSAAVGNYSTVASWWAINETTDFDYTVDDCFYMYNWATATYYNFLENSGSSWLSYYATGITSGNKVWYAMKLYQPERSEFLTTCCTQLGTINGSVNWSNAATAVVSWDNLDHVSSWTVKYKTHAAGGYTTWAGEQSTAAGRRSVTITGLAPCTNYDFQIIANPASGYCDKDQTIEDSQTHNWTVTKTGVTNVTAASLSAIPATTCTSGFGPITITAATGYALPADITVTNATKSWNSSTGALSISSVTGNVSITITPTCVSPVITADPADADYYVGDAPTALSVTATLASGTLTYLWKVSTNGGSTWSDAVGTNNTSSYSGASLSTASAGTLKFKCIVGNSEGGCTVESGVATITITAASYFTNGATVFVQADSKDYSAWKDDACVKAWFNASGAGGAAQTTYWLFDATDTDAGKKLFAAIVPSTGDLNQVTLQRFQSDCLAEHWYNNNGTLTKASSGGVNTFRSYGSADNNVAWNGSSTTLNLYGSQNSWASSLATFADQGNGVWTATVSNYTPDATSKTYKIKTSYNNGWIGNTGDNEDATLSGMIVGSTYNVTATLDIKDHSLVMSKTFVKGTVHFNLQGHGSDISDLTNVAAGSKISAPSPAPTDAEYDFGGWYKEPACTNAWNFASDVVNETMTLYAKWTPHNFTITYEGLAGASNTNPTSYTVVTPTITLVNPGSRTGYTFAGWTCGGDPITQINVGSTGDKTITATWSINTPNLAVSAADHVVITATPASESAIEEGANRNVNYNKTITLNCTPDEHWNLVWDVYKTGESSTKVALSGNGDGATFTMPDYAVTVSAVMTEAAYKTVCFKNNGEDIDGYASVKVYVGESPIAPTLTDGTSGDACDPTSDKHYGWTKETWTSTIATQSEIDARTGTEAVYAKSAALPVVAAGDPSTITYHAVWAAGSGSPAITPPTPIVYWERQSIAADKDISATTGTGTLRSNAAFTAATYIKVYNCTSLPSTPTVTLSGLNMSGATGSTVAISFYTRGTSASAGTLTVKYTNGGVESTAGTVDVANGLIRYHEVNGVPKTATQIKLEHSKSSGNLAIGTIRIFEPNTTEYTFTELDGTNTDGWTNSDWDGYYLITNASTYALDGNGIGEKNFATVSPSDNKIVTTNIGAAFEVTYVSENGYKIQGVGCGDYLNTASNSVAPSASVIYHSSMSYNSVVDNSSNTLKWNSSKFGFYASAGTAIKLYKILASYSTFLTTCCTQYDISGASTSGTAVTGGTLTSTDNSACEDREVKITANVSDGYRFDSWTITAGGSPVARKDGSAEIEDGKPIYVFDMPAADVTVNAAFTRVYTVTYDANGGTGEMIDVNSPYAAGDKVTVLTNTFTKAGYNFDSWSYSPAVTVTAGKFDMPSSDVTITAQWTAKPLNNIILAQTEAEIYDQQYVQIDVTYDPSDVVTKGYTLTGPALTKVVTTGSTQTQLKISATKAGVVISEVVSETVSIKANADETKTASVVVTIKPLPRVHFTDIIHNVVFGDVVEEIVGNVLSGAKTTPTHSDVSDPGENYNSCERGHLHLLGWIESTWADAHPGATSGEITGAGSGIYYEAGASINVEVQNGKTFYAVWCIVE